MSFLISLSHRIHCWQRYKFQGCWAYSVLETRLCLYCSLRIWVEVSDRLLEVYDLRALAEFISVLHIQTA